MKLSERQTAALLALARCDKPITGHYLALLMRDDGRPTSPAAAHQAASGLVHRELATKGNRDECGYIRYELTDKGREVAGGAQ